METELLNEYRSEISRVWTDSETRFTSNGPVRRLDPKMAVPCARGSFGNDYTVRPLNPIGR